VEAQYCACSSFGICVCSNFAVWNANSKQTDDVGVFCSPLSEEYYLAAQHFSLDRSEVKGLCERVIDSIFTGAEEQSRLRTLYANWDGWVS
jgi:hypothetical protein